MNKKKIEAEVENAVVDTMATAIETQAATPSEPVDTISAKISAETVAEKTEAVEVTGVDNPTENSPSTTEIIADGVAAATDAATTTTADTAPPSFYSVKKEKPAKANPIDKAAEKAAAKAAKPKTEPINNIQFGLISPSILNAIKPGMTIQARFFQQEIKIQYRVQPNDDDANKALAVLRDAVFAAKLGRPLPGNCEVVSTYGAKSIATQLAPAIAPTGEIDAYIECFE